MTCSGSLTRTAIALNDGVEYKGFVEWQVFDKHGNLKESFSSHNALNGNPGLDDTVNRLIGESADVDLADTGTGDGADAFARIFVASNARSGVGAAYSAKSIASLVGSDTAGPDVGSNPAQGTVGVATSGGGSGTVSETFEAEGSQNIRQLALVKTASTAASTDTQPADDDILATQDVTITLADEDTLAITWTVTASGS